MLRDIGLRLILGKSVSQLLEYAPDWFWEMTEIASSGEDRGGGNRFSVGLHDSGLGSRFILFPFRDTCPSGFIIEPCSQRAIEGRTRDVEPLGVQHEVCRGELIRATLNQFANFSSKFRQGHA
jgi:hypothetical protein